MPFSQFVAWRFPILMTWKFAHTRTPFAAVGKSHSSSWENNVQKMQISHLAPLFKGTCLLCHVRLGRTTGV